MKKIAKILTVSFIIVLIFTSCSYKETVYINGIKVVNNSSKQIKSIAKNYYNNTEVGINADNSFIEKGDEIFFECSTIDNYKFSITIIDKNDVEYISQNFIKDFSSDALYYIYIIDAPNESVAFSDRGAVK